MPGRGRFFISGRAPPSERLRPTQFTPATVRPDRRTTDVEPSPRQRGSGRTADGGGHYRPLPALLLVAGLGGRVSHGRAVVLARPANGVRAPGHRGRAGGARQTQLTPAPVRPDRRTTYVEPSPRQRGSGRTADGGGHYRPLPALLLVAGLGGRVSHGRAVVLARPANGVRAPGHRGRAGGAR